VKPGFFHANTGTEAAMAAGRLARGYAGKPRFIKKDE